jgi:enoyl-CoA hydratase/carnithine racemase
MSLSNEPAFRVVTDEHVARILLTRGQGNHLSNADLDNLGGALLDIARTPVKTVLLMAAEGDFCAGRTPPNPGSDANAMTIRRQQLEPVLRLFGCIRGLDIPVIAVVTGKAFGMGCALATACDLTLAASSARFRLPEMERNLPPTLALTCMARHVRPKDLAWLALTAEEIDAPTALQLGMVNRVVPDVEIQAQATELALTLARRSRDALITVKQYLRAGPSIDPSLAPELAASLLANVLSSTE